MPDTLVPPEVFAHPEINEAIMQLHNGGDADNVISYLTKPLSDDPDSCEYNVRRIDILASLSITSASPEWDSCAHCYDIEPVYKYSVIHKDNSVAMWYTQHYDITDSSIGYSSWQSKYSYCKKCVRMRLMDIHLDNLSRIVAISTFRLIVPNSVFPEPSHQPDMCESCDRAMLDADSAHRIQAGYMRQVQATGSDGNIHTVHRNCTWICNQCNGDFVLRGSQAVDRNLLDNNWVCTSCFDPDTTELPQCDSCSSYCTDDLTWSDYRGDDRCQSCYDEYIECQDCGYEYAEDDGHSCDNDSDEGSSYIYNYSYKPSPRFFGDDRVYMGIELEVEASQRRANLHEGAEYVATFADHGSRLYLKSDGSLSYGFEIVTHPHSLKEYHSLDWSWLNKLKTMGYRSWDASSCGIHVHVGLSAFVNENHQIRFTKFIYDNERQVKRIAGRASSYATFNDKGKAISKIKRKGFDTNRYSAVNVQNEHTLEVRVFKGSLRKERVLSAIEFVHAVTEYTRALEIVPKLKPFSWVRFVAYVAANADTYPNLFIIINETFESDTTANDQEND